MNRHQSRANSNSKLRRTSNSPGAQASTGGAVPGVAGLLQAGLKHHQAGRLAEAEGCYRRVLAAQPDHADALHLLGVLYHQRGEHARAIELMNRAVALRPNVPACHANLAEAYRAILMGHARQRDALAHKQAAGSEALVASAAVNGALSLFVLQQVLEFGDQTLMRLLVVGFI